MVNRVIRSLLTVEIIVFAITSREILAFLTVGIIVSAISNREILVFLTVVITVFAISNREILTFLTVDIPIIAISKVKSVCFSLLKGQKSHISTGFNMNKSKKLFKMACVLFEFENNPITTAKNTVDGLDMQPHKAPVINEIITDRILIVPI